GKNALQGLDRGRDAGWLLSCVRRRNAGQRCFVVRELGEQCGSVDWTMNNGGRAEGKGPGILEPRRLIGDEDDLRVFWLAFQPILERRQLRLIMKVDIDERMVLGRGLQGFVQQLELDLKQVGELAPQFVWTSSRVSYEGYLMHVGFPPRFPMFRIRWAS